MENLRKAGERLGKYELEKKYAIALEDYDRAKSKKAQAQDYRKQVYESIGVEDLLELNGVRVNNIIRIIAIGMSQRLFMSSNLFTALGEERFIIDRQREKQDNSGQ